LTYIQRGGLLLENEKAEEKPASDSSQRILDLKARWRINRTIFI